MGPGGAQALQSHCSQSASSLQLDALEESLAEEQELLETSHITQLRAEVSSLQKSVGHLVLLLDSFHKGDHNGLQLRSECAQLSFEHEWETACRDKLAKKKGINKKTPATKGNTTEWTSQKTSSSKRSLKNKNENNKKD